ncbi:DUF4270 family protein [Flavobacteriaceae bacterium Ap0902]|nr:DUF4270 family protein [Flavobacteriaceae bacterium Ap0902]
MINKIFGSQILWIVLLLGFITSCEQEDNLVGYDIVGGNAANFEKAYVNLTARTIGADTLRSDGRVLYNATIGSYYEPIFGSTKSSYYSQVRLGRLDPQFGEEAQVDSVVLSIPVYAITSDTISKSRSLFKTTYRLSNSDENCTVTDTLTQYLKTVKFPLDSVYGNAEMHMTLRVQRVIENMGTIDSIYYSNKNFQTGEMFGSKVIDNSVVRNSIIQYGSSNPTDSTVISRDTSPNVKVRLDGMNAFVQDEIVNQQGSSNLGDQISFISNVLQGIKIDVVEENGFIFNIAPSEMSMIAYISSNNPNFIDSNGDGIHDPEENCPVVSVLPRRTETLEFIVGSSMSNSSNRYYNVSQNTISNTNGMIMNNPSDPSVNYLKGMGGAKVVLSMDPLQIEGIRNNVDNNGWAINEAHIKVYPETSVQGILPLPRYLYLYNASHNDVLPDYGTPASVEDFPNTQAFPYGEIAMPYNSEEGYYLLRCTEFLKNIVEKNAPIDDLMLELGTFTGVQPTDLFFEPDSPFNSNRIYNPFRLAIHGTNPVANLEKKLQLEIYYGVKN